MQAIDRDWTVQPPLELIKGDYYRMEQRFPPYFQGIEGQFPSDEGHLGIVEAVKNDGRLVYVELNERTEPGYYKNLYSDVSKRRSDFSFWQLTKERMQAGDATITEGLLHVEQQMLAQQRLSGRFDLLTTASNSAKMLCKIAKQLEQQMDKPSSQRFYSYAINFGYGITGWLKVVVEGGRIIKCRYDEIFADHPDDIAYPELKKYYRQGKYDSPTYEDPFPPMFDRHAFIAGFKIQTDNLEKKVVATQDMLDLTGLPHTTGRDLGPIWDNPNPVKQALDMSERPIYPVWNNYLQVARVVHGEMVKDGVLEGSK